MFDADAMLFPTGVGHEVRFGIDNGPGVRMVTANLPHFAIWQKPGAPFVGAGTGSGNFVRGAQLNVPQIQRATADYMGMLATVMNAMALQDACESIGLETRVLSSIDVPNVAEKWIRRRAMRHLEKRRVVIIAAGTGNPHFTTDTAAAQRAIELGCDVIIKATKVDGVYDKDPKKHKDAKRYERVTYLEALQKGLRFMDATAVALCMEHKMPLIVLDMKASGDVERAMKGEKVGTLIEA